MDPGVEGLGGARWRPRRARLGGGACAHGPPKVDSIWRLY